MFYGPPTANDLKLQYTVEFNPNSPRLRISILSYLLENGINPTNIENFTEVAESLVAFVSSGQGDFVAELEGIALQIQADADAASATTVPDNKSTEDQGYKYL